MPASLYNPETANIILSQLKKGKPLTDICAPDSMPKPQTVIQWTSKYPDFKNQYNNAKKSSIDAGRTPQTGRPSTYDPLIAEDILDRISQGESIVRICNKTGYPSYPTLARWLIKEGNESFRSAYQRARRLQADYHIEETISIADKAVKQIKKLEDPRHSSAIAKITTDRIRARQWKAARMNPQHWSDKQQIDVSGMVKMVKMDDVKKHKQAGTGKKKKAKKKP